MNQADVMTTLTGLGLSQNEAKVYTAMLSRTDFSATDAATAAEVPTQMIYRILNRLMEKGFCMEVSSQPKRFTTTDPDIAIGGLVRQQDHLVASARSMLPDLHDLFAAGRGEANGFDSVKILRDLDTAIAMTQELNLTAREEVLFFVKQPYIGNRASIKRQVEALPPKNPHSPKVRALYETWDRANLPTEMIEKSIEIAGEEARMIEHLPVKATVYDRKKLLIHLKNQDLRQVSWMTLVIEHEDLARILVDTFELNWQRAMDFWTWKEAQAI